MSTHLAWTSEFELIIQIEPNLLNVYDMEFGFRDPLYNYTSPVQSEENKV